LVLFIFPDPLQAPVEFVPKLLLICKKTPFVIAPIEVKSTKEEEGLGTGDVWLSTRVGKNKIHVTVLFNSRFDYF
jgi:hypothetical protein